MDTKSSTTLAILEKCPPIFTSPENAGFSLAYPPTSEQVLLHYHGYHKYLQNTTKRQSSVKDAISLVIKDTVEWWNNSGIKLKEYASVETMVQNLLKEFKLRKKNINRNTDAEVNRRKEFLQSLKHTFWVVKPNYENLI